MGHTVQIETLAVLGTGLWHRVELNDGPHCTDRASGVTRYRFMAQCSCLMCLTIQTEPLAVLGTGLWHRVELNDVHHCTDRASGAH